MYKNTEDCLTNSNEIHYVSVEQDIFYYPSPAWKSTIGFELVNLWRSKKSTLPDLVPLLQLVLKLSKP